MYLPFVISETIEHATPINAGSPINNKWSPSLKSVKPFLSLKIKGPGEKSYTLTNTMPYKQDSSKVDHNSSNVNKVADKYGTASLENFFD